MRDATVRDWFAADFACSAAVFAFFTAPASGTTFFDHFGMSANALRAVLSLEYPSTRRLPTPIALIATFAALNIFPHGTAFNAVEMHAMTSPSVTHFFASVNPMRSSTRPTISSPICATNRSASATAYFAASRCAASAVVRSRPSHQTGGTRHAEP